MRGDGLIGMRLPEFSATVDRTRLLAFGTAIGEARPEYRDLATAIAMGHPDLPAPPTFLFALEFERPQPYLALEVLGAPLSAALHGEQEFVDIRICHAGDQLDFVPVISGYRETCDGRLGFVKRHTTVGRRGAVVAKLINTLAIRWGVPA